VNLIFIPLVDVAVAGLSGEADRDSTLEDRLDAEAEADADLVAALALVLFLVFGLVISGSTSGLACSGDADSSDLVDDGASDSGESPPNASIVMGGI